MDGAIKMEQFMRNLTKAWNDSKKKKNCEHDDDDDGGAGSVIILVALAFTSFYTRRVRQHLCCMKNTRLYFLHFFCVIIVFSGCETSSSQKASDLPVFVKCTNIDNGSLVVIGDETKAVSTIVSTIVDPSGEVSTLSLEMMRNDTRISYYDFGPDGTWDVKFVTDDDCKMFVMFDGAFVLAEPRDDNCVVVDGKVLSLDANVGQWVPSVIDDQSALPPSRESQGER